MKRDTEVSKNEIVVYQPNETTRLNVRVSDESVWLSQSKIGELFGVDRSVVNRHIHNIYQCGELIKLRRESGAVGNCFRSDCVV